MACTKNTRRFTKSNTFIAPDGSQIKNKKAQLIKKMP